MKEKLKQSIGIIGIPIILIIGTLVIYFFGKGYRFDIFNGQIEKTGVISVKTIPRRATVYIDGSSIGKTPKATGGLEEGTHTIKIEKDGYFTWSHDVDILAEQLVPLEVALFLEEPSIEMLSIPTVEADTDKETSTEATPDEATEANDEEAESAEQEPIYSVENVFVDKNNRIAVFPVSFSGTTMEIWTYPLQRQFWELNPSFQLISAFNPSIIFPNSPEPPTVSMEISPDAQKILVVMTSGVTSHYYVLDTSQYIADPEQLSQLEQHDDVPPTWSLDSLHLIFSKNNELRSYNTETSSQVVIAEKNENESFIWTTNRAGQLFLYSKETDVCTIERADPDGSSRTTIIRFPRKDGTRVLFDNIVDGSPLEDTDSESATESPACEIEYMYLTPDEDQILLFSKNNIITYSLDDDEAEVYNADNPLFISFSPDEEKFIYIDGIVETYLKEFRFVIEDADPVHRLGPSILMPLDLNTSYENFIWHPESRNVLFTEYDIVESGTLDEMLILETARIRTVDTENKQLFTISPAVSNQPFGIDSSGKFLIALSQNLVRKITIQE